MSPQKQLTIMMVVAASLGSFLAGYLFIQPRTMSTIVGEQQGTILDRFNGPATESASAPATVPLEAAPTPLPDGLTKVSDDAAMSATSDTDSDGVLYYQEGNGFVSRVNLSDHQSTLISNTALPNLSGVIWSPDKKKVITAYATRNGRAYDYYDYDTHENIPLDASVTTAVFSPDSSSIALAESIGDETDILIAQPDRSSPQTVIKTHFPSVFLAWPDAGTISLVVPTADGTWSLYTLTPDGQLTQVLSEEQNLKTVWSPDGSQLLYSTVADGEPLLTLHVLASGAETVIPVTASANNCDWYLDGGSFICAADDNGATDIKTVAVSDDSVQTLADDLSISPQSVFLSHLEDFFVMVGADHKIYAYRLPQ